jgi:hypothetical protein
VGSQRHSPAALPPGKTRYPLYRRLGGPQTRSGQVWKTSPPAGIRFPDRPARSESLYRLSYPGVPQFLCTWHFICNDSRLSLGFVTTNITRNRRPRASNMGKNVQGHAAVHRFVLPFILFWNEYGKDSLWISVYHFFIISFTFLHRIDSLSVTGPCLACVTLYYTKAW